MTFHYVTRHLVWEGNPFNQATPLPARLSVWWPRAPLITWFNNALTVTDLPPTVQRKDIFRLCRYMLYWHSAVVYSLWFYQEMTKPLTQRNILFGNVVKHQQSTLLYIVKARRFIFHMLTRKIGDVQPYSLLNSQFWLSLGTKISRSG